MRNQEISVLGMGFACIDMIDANGTFEYSPGGTAANVMCIIAQLGVDASLLMPMYNDRYTPYLLSEIGNCGVNLIKYKKSQKATPRVVEWTTAEGDHGFYTVCPKCGERLNQIDLPSAHDVKKVGVELVEKKNAVFFDRISAGIRECIQACRDSGVWSFYEPNSCRQYSSFFKNVADVDIVKFSSDRIPSQYIEKLTSDLDAESQTKLIIVSHGSRGLSFSVKNNCGEFCDWVSLKSKPLTKVIDTSGAGDWLAASFLREFLEKYPHVEKSLEQSKMTKILENAQAFAAFSCMYQGAQGVFRTRESVEELNDQFECKARVIVPQTLPQKTSGECSYCRSII